MEKPKDVDRAPVDAVVMRLVVELTVDDSYAVCKESDDKSERDWFYDDLLGDPKLLLQSNLVGDTIGTIKVVSVEPPLVDVDLPVDRIGGFGSRNC